MKFLRLIAVKHWLFEPFPEILRYRSDFGDKRLRYIFSKATVS